MTAQTKPVLKSYFETGDKPTATQFADLIDSIPGTAGVLADSEIPATIARDTEVTATTSAAVSAHAAASDPHGDRAYAEEQAISRKTLTDYQRSIVVDPSGNGDYSTLGEAFSSITDASANNRYVIFDFSLSENGFTPPRYVSIFRPAEADRFRVLCQIERAAMVGFWPMNEVAGTSAVDYSGNGRICTYTGNYALGAAWVNGRTAVQFTAGAINLYSALLAGFNSAAGTIILDVQVPAGVWGDATDRYILNILTSANSQIRVRRYGSSNNGIYIEHLAGGVTKAIPVITRYETRPFQIAFTWSAAANQLIGYINGSQVAIPTTGLGVWGGALYANLCCAGAIRSDSWGNPFTGKIGGVRIYNVALSGETIAEIHDAQRPTTGVIVLGDSKSGPSYPWYRLAMDQLSTDIHAYEERPMRYYGAGWKISDLRAYIESNLAAEWQIANRAWVNIGANDLSAGTSESSYKADLRTIINALLAKYNISIRIAKPWRRGYNAPSVTMATWIDQVIAEYGAYDVGAGPNENIWMKGTDDGVTNTIDGTHPNPTGIINAAAQWSALG